MYLIIFQKEGFFRLVKDLSSKKKESSGDSWDKWTCALMKLGDHKKDGINYWCRKSKQADERDTIFIANQADKWGFCYHEEDSLEYANYKGSSKSFPMDMINFLPGGLPFTMGPSTHTWTLLKCIDNTQGETEITWSDKITTRVGYNKSLTEQIERHWDLSSVMDIGITSKILTAQMRMPAAYGGKQINTEAENWNEQQEHKEAIAVKIPEKKALYIWQFELKIGEKNMAFSK